METLERMLTVKPMVFLTDLSYTVNPNRVLSHWDLMRDICMSHLPAIFIDTVIKDNVTYNGETRLIPVVHVAAYPSDDLENFCFACDIGIKHHAPVRDIKWMVDGELIYAKERAIPGPVPDPWSIVRHEAERKFRAFTVGRSTYRLTEQYPQEFKRFFDFLHSGVIDTADDPRDFKVVV